MNENSISLLIAPKTRFSNAVQILWSGDLDPASIADAGDEYIRALNQHEALLRSAYAKNPDATPLLALSSSVWRPSRSVNSSDRQITADSIQRYDAIKTCLNSLYDEDEEECPVEHEALDTALEVLTELRRTEYSPPAVSWHGGDAVVMLWVIGDATYAVTITAGEIGYVVRRNRETVRQANCLSVESFRFPSLTS